MSREVAPYLAHLKALPFVRNAAFKTSLVDDGSLRLATPTRAYDLPVEIKRTHLSQATAEHIVASRGKRKGLLVLAPAVGRELAELFAEHHVNFVDLAGNCFVQLGNSYLAKVQGQRAVSRPASEKSLRGPAYRVLFALLAEPSLVNGTARALATAAGGVSPQTANDVRARLLALGIVLKRRAGLSWNPGHRQQALDMFLNGFPTLMSTFVIGRYRAKQHDTKLLEESLSPRLAKIGEWRWGGGAGAQRLTGFYRGERTLVYFREPDVDAIKSLPLIADSSGDVVLMRAPGPLAFEGPNDEVVHPLLVYADLLMEGHDRAREAAAEVHRRFLEVRS
jgi:hypothetical protein